MHENEYDLPQALTAARGLRLDPTGLGNMGRALLALDQKVKELEGLRLPKTSEPDPNVLDDSPGRGRYRPHLPQEKPIEP